MNLHPQPDAAQVSDAELLREFCATRDDAAFRTLVQRHAGMVRATALRITGQAELADEIAQGVFVLLVSKAPSLQPADTLGPWLHRVAVLQAKANVRKESRRSVLLQAWAAKQTADEPADDAAWQEALPALDEAIHALPTQDQRLVVMRFYERASYRDAGLALGGKSADAVRMQLQRALERMGEFLRRRGVVLSLAALTGLLGSAGKVEPSAKLVDRCTRAGLKNMPAPGGNPPPLLSAVHMAAGAALFLAGAAGMQLLPQTNSDTVPASILPARRDAPRATVSRPVTTKVEETVVERLLAKIAMLDNDFEHPEVLAEAILLVSQLDAESFPVVWEVLLKRTGAKFDIGMVPARLAAVVASRWARLDPAGALAAAQKLPDGRRCAMIAWETWHAADSSAAAIAVREMLQGMAGSVKPTVWKRLARADPLLAQELLIELRNKSYSGIFATLIFQSWMHSRGFPFTTPNDLENKDIDSMNATGGDRRLVSQFLNSLPVLDAVTLRGCVLWLESVTHGYNNPGQVEGCLDAVLRRIPPDRAERNALAAWVKAETHLSDDLRSALLEHLTISQ